MSPTIDQVKAMLPILIAPYLPDATVDDLCVSEACHCYSEWTTEPPRFEVTLKAPWGKTEKELGLLINVLEPLVRRWAEGVYEFTGCSCCDGRVSCWVRVRGTSYR